MPNIGIWMMRDMSKYEYQELPENIQTSSPFSDDSDKDKDIEHKSNNLTMVRKYNGAILYRKTLKDITSTKGKGQVLAKTMAKINLLVSVITDEGIKSKTNAFKVVTRSKVDGKSGHEPLPLLEKSLQAGSTVIPHQKVLFHCLLQSLEN
ncbi:hypothetical protein LOAG_11445 [Loa loa]|uniref:Uncharacterized protein n=1 Tax=Loa loa TaxID=7209 RepID=A0A1S0TNI5_LOALO|nr:hypothetical protein LOAG_11445 [Loa loa]EFO17058.1 hypothetical protein LOAG_11445 [Loa loa]